MSEAEEIAEIAEAAASIDYVDGSGTLVSTFDAEEPVPYTVTDYGADDSARLLSDINLRLERIEHTVNGLKDGVNTIGEMMNQVADMFSDMVNKVNSGGIGALLGNLMGGNKNG